MRHVLLAALLLGCGVVFTSIAASALQGWAMTKVVRYAPEPAPETAEFLLPTPGRSKRGSLSAADCVVPPAGPMSVMKPDTTTTTAAKK